MERLKSWHTGRVSSICVSVFFFREEYRNRNEMFRLQTFAQDNCIVHTKKKKGKNKPKKMELYNIEKARRMIVLLRRVFEQNKEVMRRMKKISI